MATDGRYIEILFKQVFQRDCPKDFISQWTRYGNIELSNAFINVFQQQCVRFGKVKLPPKKPMGICKHISALLSDSRQEFISAVVET